MKSKEQIELESIYSKLENDKNLISEDANESLSSAIVWVVLFGIPVIMDFFSRKYPELKEKFEQIKTDIKTNQQTKEELKAYLAKSKQTAQDAQNWKKERAQKLGLKEPV